MPVPPLGVPMVPIEVAFHAIFGIGAAIIFRSGLVLARRTVMPGGSSIQPSRLRDLEAGRG
jgi:hypothetical protein